MAADVAFQSLFKHPCVQNFNPYSKAAFADLAACHTAAKGYHLSQCDHSDCGLRSHSYHCCANRHCPNCGTRKTDAWIEARMAELLPTAYYHVVFTLPHELNALLMGNRAKLFDALFRAASQTLLRHAQMPQYLGAEPGITMVLHTWGQDLSFHPHVHCIVSAGGVQGQQWVEAKRKNNRFLFPQASMAKMYKALFMQALEKDGSISWNTGKAALLKAVKYKRWNVYAKAPFSSPARVVEYLGRYTHKIAITRHRVLEVNQTHVKFAYKDYAHGGKTKQMMLAHREFIRRFEQHILPRRFVKIRHLGYLRLQGKRERLARIRTMLSLEPAKANVKIPQQIRMLEKYGKDMLKCPSCGQGRMTVIFDTRDRANRKPRPIRIQAAPS